MKDTIKGKKEDTYLAVEGDGVSAKILLRNKNTHDIIKEWGVYYTETGMNTNLPEDAPGTIKVSGNLFKSFEFEGDSPSQ